MAFGGRAKTPTSPHNQGVGWRETTKNIRAELVNCTLLFLVTLELPPAGRLDLHPKLEMAATLAAACSWYLVE